jgi:membrane-associated phospholipid phosphatase
MLSDQKFLNWQKSLGEKKYFRWFWRSAGIYVVALLLVTGAYLIFNNPKALVLALGAFVFARFVISGAVHWVYKKSRPYQRIGFTQTGSKFFLSGVTKRLNSMPSSHAASLAAISVVFYWFFPVLGPAWMAAALINGVARVVLGYHDPEDIIVGWVIGTASAFLALYVGGVIG